MIAINKAIEINHLNAGKFFNSYNFSLTTCYKRPPNGIINDEIGIENQEILLQTVFPFCINR